MSLTRSLFNEFRPLFRMLEDPFFNADPFAVAPRQLQRFQTQGDPFQSFFNGGVRSPNLRLSDEADKFVVEAEVPGVRKENLDVSIGDGGRSLTIKGNMSASSADMEATTPASTAPGTQGEAQASTQATESTSTEVAHNTQTSNEVGEAKPQWSSQSSFVRTVWLPQPVDATKVSAKLDHGVLQLEIPKVKAETHRIEVA